MHLLKNTTLKIIFNVITTLPCSTLIFNSLTISVRHKCVGMLEDNVGILLISLVFFVFFISFPTLNPNI